MAEEDKAVPDEAAGPDGSAGPAEFGPVGHQALPQQIVGRLLDMVRQRHLGPGDQLPPERDLAVTMRVSRSSLREALRALAVMGVLEMRRGAGTFVSSLEPDVLVRQLGLTLSLSEASFDQLFAARLVVEPAICAMAAQNMDDETLRKLDACVQGAIDSVNDPAEFVRYDMEMHSLICATAGNALLSQFMASISSLNMASRQETGFIPGQTERTPFDHQLIVAALRARDPDAASTAMRIHLRRLRQEVQEVHEHQEP